MTAPYLSHLRAKFQTPIPKQFDATNEYPIIILFEVQHSLEGKKILQLLHQISQHQAAQIVQLIHDTDKKYLKIEQSDSCFPLIVKVAQCENMHTLVMQVFQKTVIVPTYVNELIANYFAKRKQEEERWSQASDFVHTIVTCENIARNDIMPNELLWHCFSYMSVLTLMKMCQVSKLWYRIVTRSEAPLIRTLEAPQNKHQVVSSNTKNKLSKVVALRCGYAITEFNFAILHDDSRINIWYVGSKYANFVQEIIAQSGNTS